jgi:hypothetical protein
MRSRKKIGHNYMRILLVYFLSVPAFAYVSGASSLAKGEFELTLKAELMRGLAGPETLPESQQRQKPSVDIYELGGGYSFGSLSWFQDVKARFTGTRFISAEERLGASLIYPKDEGWIFGFELSSNFLHEVDKLFGVFLRIQHPVDMSIAKFVNPKIDRVGIGLQSAFKFSDSFGQETLIYYGSGIKQDGFVQNPSLSVSLLAAWILNQAALKPPQGLGLLELGW